MTDEYTSVPLVGIIVGIVIIVWSALWFFLDTTLVGKLLSGILIITGLGILVYVIKEIQIMKKGEKKVRFDERGKINRYKASDRGFWFIFGALMITILLNTFNLINEVVFISLIQLIVAMGTAIFFLSYYFFEWRGDENPD
ncbi:MAG: hypothetical protein ACFFC7_21395 [Candidatus Hermodarchaeota archaeon]